MPQSSRVRFSRLIGLVLSLLIAGCRQDQLAPVNASLRFEVDLGDQVEDHLDFPPAFADARERSLEVRVINESKATLSVAWTSLAKPFAVKLLPTSLPPGATTFPVFFTPETAGEFSQKLSVSSPGVKTAELLVGATVRSIPACTPSAPCLTATFDVDLAKCVETTAPDGVECDPQTKCVLSATCQGGRCVGTPKTCNDGNECTVDVCYTETGCEFLPRPPCPGDGACNVGVCNPARGCELAPAVDGTACGSLHSCNAAEVCISGACVVRDPPDGYVCAEASPCQGEGRCIADTCVHESPATPLVPSWTFDSTTTGDADAGVAALELHDFVMEPSGAMSLGGFFQAAPILRANTADAIAAPLGASRRCILWNNRLVCADYPAAPNGKVSAIELGSGATAWTFDIRTARPDFLMLTTQIFLARLVVQGSDRLAALYEAYPKNPPIAGNTQCRTYFLAVMNASGRLIQAQRVQDPLLDQCNHPHPYGVAADSIGNLFIAFSPTRSQQAPLVPDNPTLLMSYTHDGIFRWKITDTAMRGGELAVARGLLYPENSSVVLNATHGTPAFALPSDLGRATIADARLVPAPQHGSTQLAGYEAGHTQLRWVHKLQGAWQFWSDQIRLASWQTSRGPRTVALTFVADDSTVAPSYALHAIDVNDGREAFTCPVTLSPRTAPQLFEVGEGYLGLMQGALDAQGNAACGKCDPPFAGSSAAFHGWQLRGIGVAHEPWVGTFGGAAHDHREEVLNGGN